MVRTDDGAGSRDLVALLLVLAACAYACGGPYHRAEPGTVSASTAARADPPNIVVILVDDLGYADLGCQGAADVRTPHIDSLAAHGIRFTNGYVTAPQCSPSRAGLLTGRYQSRFGHEYNCARQKKEACGLAIGEGTIADRLKAAGYVTGLVGKWHLGDSEQFAPYARGFDESYWHPNGGVYFPQPRDGKIRNLRRGRERVTEQEYSTDAFGREAVAFIERHRDEPFFLLLSFVAPHWPLEAKPEHLALYAEVEDLQRRTFLAMMHSLDENVGRVLDRLRSANLEEHTLVFFISDNGGPTGSPRRDPHAPFVNGLTGSRNDPLRGEKNDLLEGGIRVPFLLQWKGRLPAGRVYEEPVITLDVLPTALAAGGTPVRAEWELDGTDLLPFLEREGGGAPHDTLYWRFSMPFERIQRWAIRHESWKLVRETPGPPALYDLATDVGEKHDLAARHPETVAELQAAWNLWQAELPTP